MNRDGFQISFPAQGRFAVGGLCFLLGLAACDKGTGEPDPGPVTVAQVIADIAAKVIFATYTDLAIKADSLQKTTALLAQTPNDTSLAAAQQAWRNARVPWELNEGFLFGPVETIPTDPSIDTWPLNKFDLDNILASSVSLTKGYVDSLEGSLKGFHAIEYIIFGDSSVGTRHASQITPREYAYIQACASALKGEVDKLLAAWSPSGGNFLATLQNAGNGSDVYATQQQAIDEYLGGMLNICDEVAGEKMFRPFFYDPPDRAQEESRWSNNSTADFANNLRSALNVYRGGYAGGPGVGLKALVEKKNPALSAQVEAEFAAAIAAILAVGRFGDAIDNNAPAKVDSATNAIRILRETLLLDVGDALILP